MIERFLMRPLDEHRQGLRDLLVTLPGNLSAVEVGSYAGESADIILRSGKVDRLACVDPWRNGYDENDVASHQCDMATIEAAFDARMTEHGDRVRKMKMPSGEASALFPAASIDLVYLDGDHRYAAVLSDVQSWLPKVKPGGWLAGHDFATESILRALHETIGLDGIETFSDSSWLYRNA